MASRTRIPGFLDVVTNKSAGRHAHLPAARRQLPAERGGPLPAQRDYVNVIVADKQPHLQYLDMDAAVMHCTKGIGIWEWASNDEGAEPDVVMACAGDIPTHGGAAPRSRSCGSNCPDLKIRFVNVVDLFRLMPATEHPHGLVGSGFRLACSPRDKPIIFNFHGYPWLIHKLTYRRTNHDNLHVRGYKEKGNINTPLELAIRTRSTASIWRSTSSTACRSCSSRRRTSRNG